jgi:uncharacterized membrane protein YjgN (DUF898 family)
MDTAVAPDSVVHDTPPLPAAATRTLAFGFTGSGREYFRIWVINLLLSLATLGIYSAWAKVRRLQYFDRSTTLGGAVFDFHGDAKAILRGRVLAVVLLAAYQYAFGFSRSFGLAVVGMLLLSLPYMMRGALRFRLGNTSYRGLRFHFDGSVPHAYRSYLAPIAVFLLPGVMAAVTGDSPWSVLPFVLYLGWPAMYGWMKRYQYGHVAYGDRHSSTALPIYEFFRIYGEGLMIAAAFAVGILVLGLLTVPLGAVLPEAPLSFGVGLLASAASALMAYVLLGPYQQVRVLNLCLPETRFPGVRFVSTLSAGGFARLQVRNLLLTLLTFGLYRPFAVVSAYRYRLAHLMIEVEAALDFDQVLATVKPTGGAAGDGTADFLGVDLSW